jgi:hypothetical protein
VRLWRSVVNPTLELVSVNADYQGGQLHSAERPPEVDRSYEPAIRVRMNSAPLTQMIGHGQNSTWVAS